MMGVLEMPEEAVGGVGGEAGMKNEGMHAAVARQDTIRTVLGTEEMNGLIRDASWDVR
jgi:hypothetical protein